MSEASERVDSTSGAAVLHGWGCTPTGEPPASAVNSNEEKKSSCLPPILTRGWRRNVLYGILVVLMILVFTNIGLTLWIISTMRLTINGIGPIKIVKGGIQLDGKAWVVESLVASTISSRVAQPITMQSYRNFSVVVSEPNQSGHAKLSIKRDSVECSGHAFEVRDAHGGNVFRATKEEVRVFSDALAIDGAGGINVKNAIQTPFVRAPPGASLQLESLTRRLELKAPKSIYLESRVGSIDITSQNNIRLNSGSIKIDAPNIVISNLKEAALVAKSQRSSHVNNMRVYQLCACATGKLFLAASDAICAANSDDDELCR